MKIYQTPFGPATFTCFGCSTHKDLACFDHMELCLPCIERHKQNKAKTAFKKELR
jgi:hypothetical protein